MYNAYADITALAQLLRNELKSCHILQTEWPKLKLCDVAQVMWHSIRPIV